MPYTPLSTTSILDVVTPETSSPSSAPKFTRHRIVKVSIDTGDIEAASRGMNMAGFEKAHIKVIPSASANPDVEVMFWSETAGKFISEHTAISKSGAGAGEAYEFTVDVYSRIIFVYVTGTIGADQQVEIQIAGSVIDHDS